MHFNGIDKISFEGVGSKNLIFNNIVSFTATASCLHC